MKVFAEALSNEPPMRGDASEEGTLPNSMTPWTDLPNERDGAMYADADADDKMIVDKMMEIADVISTESTPLPIARDGGVIASEMRGVKSRMFYAQGVVFRMLEK